MKATPKPSDVVVLLTSGQPSINPRLVKEADALAGAGYTVIVIYQYWNDWATKYDAELMATKSWKAIRVGGSPQGQKAIYSLSRLTHKLGLVMAKSFGFKSGIGELAIGRATTLLFNEAIKHPAKLYIAHNLAALPAAVKAAKQLGAACGFDAEDYHRNEVYDNPNEYDVRLKTFIEEKYIPQTDNLSASSEAIAGQYFSVLKQKAVTILNVFPKTDLPAREEYKAGDVLKLFWFSQSIGANRGLGDVVKALKNCGKQVQLHLLGDCADAEKSRLLAIADEAGLHASQLQFHNPVQPQALFNFAASFHIGIASETGTPLNRDLCLTNKVFTYLNAGLAIIASETRAQKQFIEKYPTVGKSYPIGDVNGLAAIIDGYATHPGTLKAAQEAAYQLSQTELNWEVESKKFISVVEQALPR